MREYNFSNSNLVLKIGGQILFIVLIIMVLTFGVSPQTFPVSDMKKMLANKGTSVGGLSKKYK
jgi:hypothetical protein